MFKDKVAVITGGANGIGQTIADEFEKNGAVVCIIDKEPNCYFIGDAGQQAVHRVGEPLDIANMVLFLCSEKARFMTGENIYIDGGMTKQMIYSGDHGCTFQASD